MNDHRHRGTLIFPTREFQRWTLVRRDRQYEWTLKMSSPTLAQLTSIRPISTNVWRIMLTLGLDSFTVPIHSPLWNKVNITVCALHPASVESFQKRANALHRSPNKKLIGKAVISLMIIPYSDHSDRSSHINGYSNLGTFVNHFQDVRLFKYVSACECNNGNIMYPWGGG